MSDSNDHAGFSFQISETPPPAQASSGTPLADLELDMGDFGEVTEPSPLPESPAQKVQGSAWLDDPVVRPPAPAAVVAPEPVPGDAAPAPKVQAREPGPQAAAPKIKKISFPKKRPATMAQKAEAAPPKLKAAPTPTKSKTKFSKSISSKDPRPALDSEPDRQIEEHGALPNHGGASEMAPPEDLPGQDQEFLTEAPRTEWGTETPTAKEIWKKARSSWHVASRQAVALSGQGLRASKALAETVNEKVKQRLREAAEERAERKAQQGAPVQAAGGGPGAASADSPLPGPSPSVAGRVILGLARSTARKVAAPASAAAAACIVYFAGSHLLGTDGSVALSKAVQGPEIPDLGTVEGPDSQKDAAEEKGSDRATEEGTPSGTSTSKKGGPAPMQTEVTDMPEGMSWPGKGLIEVVTSKDELVYVDGVFTGRGPLRRIPVSPGEHEVSIRADGKERTGSVEVQANKNTRAVFEGP